MSASEPGLDIHELIHDAGKGVLGVRFLGEEMLMELEEAADAESGSSPERDFMKRRLKLIVGYSDLYAMTIGNLRSAHLGAPLAVESPQFVDLGALIDDACFLFDHIGRNSRNIACRVLSSDAVHIYGKETDLRRAVLNVLDNALKYSFHPKPGERGRHIAVSATRWQERGAAITVRNFGNGILSTERVNVLRARERGQLAILDEKPGTGLGLHEVARVAMEHGGTVMIESRPAPRTMSETDFLELLRKDPRAARAVPWTTTITLRIVGLREKGVR